MSKVLLTGDIHLREDSPSCWVDDYQIRQYETIEWLRYIQKKEDAELLIAGDVFHRSQSSLAFLSSMVGAFAPFKPSPVAIPGNHDLPNHNLNKYNRCGLNILALTGAIDVSSKVEQIQLFDDVNLFCFPFGHEDFSKVSNKDKKSIALCHFMTYDKDLPYPGCKSPDARSVLTRATGVDWLVVGDNHQSFDVKLKDGRRLINPGGLFRTTAAQMEHKPRVALLDTDSNELTWIEAPISYNEISRERLDTQKSAKADLDDFVSSVKCNDIDSLDYVENVLKAMKSAGFTKSENKLILELIGE